MDEERGGLGPPSGPPLQKNMNFQEGLDSAPPASHSPDLGRVDESASLLLLQPLPRDTTYIESLTSAQTTAGLRYLLQAAEMCISRIPASYLPHCYQLSVKPGI